MSHNGIDKNDPYMLYLLDMEKEDFDTLFNDTVTDMPLSDAVKVFVLLKKPLAEWRRISKETPWKTTTSSNVSEGKKPIDDFKSDIESFAEKIAPEIGTDKDEVLESQKYAKFDMNNIHDDYEDALSEVENEMFNGSGDIMSKTPDELRKIIIKNHWNNEFDLDSNSISQLRLFLFNKLKDAVNDKMEEKNNGFKTLIEKKFNDGDGRLVVASIEDEKEAIEWLNKLLKTWC